MSSKLKSYLIIILYLVIGLAIVGLTQFINIPDWVNPAFILLLFVVVNYLSVRLFNLKTEIRNFWTIRKVYFFPIGVLAGGFIAASPVLAGLLTGSTTFGQLAFDTNFTGTSAVVTFVIVIWEELWFRGIFLNYCNRSLSAINISLVIGLLFMLVHSINPNIDLLKTGPTLFFAGALLTIVYFYFKTIWLSIGSNLDKHWLFGNEGYLGALVLAILFMLFVKLTLNREKSVIDKRTDLN